MKRTTFYLWMHGLLCLLASACHSAPSSNDVLDLSHSRIGVLLGSSQDHYATQAFPSARLLRIDMSSDLIMALKSGSCDAVLFSSFTAIPILQSEPSLQLLEEMDDVGHLGIGFRKEDEQLCQQFNTFLQELKQSDTYTDMYRRWLQGNAEQATVPPLESAVQGQPLRVGTTLMSVPFSHTQDNRPAGYDIELTTRFASYLHRPIEFVPMNFGSLIPALQTGQVDLIANNIMMTEERSKAIRFSESYIDDPTVVLVLRKEQPSKPLATHISQLGGQKVGVLTGSSTSTLSSVLPTLFSPAAACSFLAFTLLYTPCVAAIAAIKRELGSGVKAAAVSVCQCVTAWIAAFAVYGIANWIL